MAATACGGFELHRVAGLRDDVQRRGGQRVGHPLGERPELRVALADDQRHGDRQLREAVPQRLHDACAEAAQRGGEAGGRLREAHLARVGGDERRLIGEQRQRGPVRGERLDPLPLDALRERIVGGAAGVALHGVGDAGRRADEDQARDAVGRGERKCERDPAAHRVAGERGAGGHHGEHVGVDRREVDRSQLRRVAMAADVGRERAIAFAERRDRRPPAAARLREAVEQDDRLERHPPHLP